MDGGGGPDDPVYVLDARHTAGRFGRLLRAIFAAGADSVRSRQIVGLPPRARQPAGAERSGVQPSYRSEGPGYRRAIAIPPRQRQGGDEQPESAQDDGCGERDHTNRRRTVLEILVRGAVRGQDARLLRPADRPRGAGKKLDGRGASDDRAGGYVESDPTGD